MENVRREKAGGEREIQQRGDVAGCCEHRTHEGGGSTTRSLLGCAHQPVFNMKLPLVMLLLLLLVLIHRDAGSPRRQETTKSITKLRLVQELREIGIQELLPCFPFNFTIEEVGVRLQPTNSILEWHFSFTGIQSSQYDGGVYHGKILLPKDYPRKPPSIAIMTPNGRWEVGKAICLSATAFHRETWDPSWNLRTLVMALRGHMLTYPREIGGILTSAERKVSLAVNSRNYYCPQCGMSHVDMLRQWSEESAREMREGGSKRQVDLLLRRSMTKKKKQPSKEKRHNHVSEPQMGKPVWRPTRRQFLTMAAPFFCLSFFIAVFICSATS